jgi:hypothetical protein
MFLNPHQVWQDYIAPTIEWLETNPLRLVIAMAGASISHIFFDLPGTDIRPRLRRIFPHRGSATIEALHYLFVSLAGGVTAMCILKPPNEAAAFLGGFSWYITLLHVSHTNEAKRK